MTLKLKRRKWKDSLKFVWHHLWRAQKSFFFEIFQLWFGLQVDLSDAWTKIKINCAVFRNWRICVFGRECVWGWGCLHACLKERVCVCVWEKEREWLSKSERWVVYVCVCLKESAWVCVWEREREKEWLCKRKRVFVFEWKRVCACEMWGSGKIMCVCVKEREWLCT